MSDYNILSKIIKLTHDFIKINMNPGIGENRCIQIIILRFDFLLTKLLQLIFFLIPKQHILLKNKKKSREIFVLKDKQHLK